jgi:hypothetical protein
MHEQEKAAHARLQELREEIVRLEDEAHSLREQIRALEIDNAEAERRQVIAHLADELQKQGIPFQQIPPQVYPGMPYITPATLAAQITYTPQHILGLMRAGLIPAYRIGSVITDPLGVRTVLARERKSATDEHAGRRPGPLSRDRKL